MRVHRQITALPSFRHAVVTIGTFDGVHAGHQRILEQIKEEARRVAGETVIITFHPHPRKIVRSDGPGILLITTLEEKLSLLDRAGIDHVVVVPFDEQFAAQTAEAYIESFLYERFRPRVVVIGYDHRFGQGRRGDYHLLEAYGARLGFEVKEIPEHVLNHITISSTRIREALLHHDITTANGFLGYDFFFEGEVVHGNKLGRTLGYPTANIQLLSAEKILPANGIYAVEALLEGEDQKRQGVMSIGTRPTIGASARTIEVFLFDFDRDIYGRHLRVFVKQFIREELKFSGLEELKAAIRSDVEQARALLRQSS